MRHWADQRVATGMFPWNVEMLVWLDDRLGVEVVGMAQGPAQSGHLQTAD